MAKSDNFFNIRGKIGELIFYVRNGKTYVKQYSGGFTKKETQNHPRVKAAQQRLGQISSFVKSFKQALTPYLWRQKDGTFHNQLISVFSHIRNSNPEKSFQEVLSSPISYLTLKNKPLNKNSKITTHNLRYDPNTNLLQINVNLMHELSEKYKGFFLEVATGWYGITNGKAHLSPPQLHYFKISDIALNQTITIPFAEADSEIEFLPFVGLAVVHTDQPTSTTPHSVHTLAVCFV